MPRRELPEVNAGSMADIAFTLLIFFLVSTTLATDKGEKVLLPKWNPDLQAPEVEKNERNVLALQIREDGSLVLEGQDFPYRDLTEESVDFLLNNGSNPLYSDSYDDAVINIVTHPDAPYEAYLEAYSNAKASFDQIRDSYAMQQFGTVLENLPDDQADEVRDKYPLKLAEKVMDEDDM